MQQLPEKKASVPTRHEWNKIEARVPVERKQRKYLGIKDPFEP